MQDRISTYPGRVKLTPVAGQEHVYDLVRMDQPVQTGTALNTQNLLSAETASAIAAATGGTAPDTPSGALLQLAEAMGASGGGGAQIIAGSYKGTGKYGAASPNTLTFAFRPHLLMVYESDMGLLFGDPGDSAKWGAQAMLAARGAARSGHYYYSAPATLFLTWGDDSVSWYASSSNWDQLNGNGYTYYYVAIGEG